MMHILTTSVHDFRRSFTSFLFHFRVQLPNYAVGIITCCNTSAQLDLPIIISFISEWAVKIPIILIAGVATSVDAPRNLLSSRALQHLSTSIFTLKSPAERMDAIIEAVLVKDCAGFSVGHKVATLLRNYFLKQEGTVTSFVRALKVCDIFLSFFLVLV